MRRCSYLKSLLSLRVAGMRKELEKVYDVSVYHQRHPRHLRAARWALCGERNAACEFIMYSQCVNHLTPPTHRVSLISLVTRHRTSRYRTLLAPTNSLCKILLWRCRWYFSDINKQAALFFNVLRRLDLNLKLTIDQGKISTRWGDGS